MSNTRLILHVKGTEAETTELPKEAVRAAVSEGKLSHSQLIWSPTENTWKQVRELPDLLPIERLILHVKGTEAETRELPKQAVRAAIAEGKITHSQLIWSPAQNTWKQVKEMPDLLPSQKLAPAPSPEVAVPVNKAAAAIIPESPTSPVAQAAASAGAPKVRVAASGTAPQANVAVASAGSPQVRTATASPAKVQASPAVPAAGTPRARAATAMPVKVQASAAVPVASKPTLRAAAPALVRTTGDLVVKNEDGFHPFKWICIGMGVIILLVLGANYALVDQPLNSRLGETSYSDVTVFGHFGAFMQPNVMVIHIPNTSKITPDNITAFFVALAHSTPQSPITRDAYARVALTSGWTAQYSFSGYSWKQLGDMDHDTDAQRKEFMMAQMGDAGGEPLMPESTLNEEMQQAKRDQAWATFVAHFTVKQ